MLATDCIAQLFSPPPNLLNTTEEFRVKHVVQHYSLTLNPLLSIEESIRKKMSDDPKQQLDKTTKIIGFRVTEEELQNVIYPVMHDCYYQLGIIDHDTLTSFLRFCVQFWMGHYRIKKQQFDMVQEEMEEE